MGRSLCLSLALLFLATVIPSNAQSEPTGAADATRAANAQDSGVTEVVFEMRGKGNFSLLCQLPNESDLQYVWKVNDTALEEVKGLQGRYTLEHAKAQLSVARGLEDDFGNYSCSLPGGGEQRWFVRANPYAKLPPNSNVVEGQSLKLVCKVTGKPYPTVTWYYNTTVGNLTEVRAALGDRAKLKVSDQGVPDGLLEVSPAQRSDAGEYRCVPGTGHHAVTVLRVKDMYAALWPFLGICAEVFILCAIILVYEKRRTKPELDDSDTDNHDQKKS